jgi:hypothetical protein
MHSNIDKGAAGGMRHCDEVICGFRHCFAWPQKRVVVLKAFIAKRWQPKEGRG